MTIISAATISLSFLAEEILEGVDEIKVRHGCHIIMPSQSLEELH
jgi:hypothetical protein